MLSQLTARTDVAIQRRACLAEFFAQFADLGVVVLHGCLGQPDLSLAHVEASASLSTSGTRCGQPRLGALPDQLPRELGQRGENAEHQLAAGGRGVDLGALTGEYLKTGTSFGKVLRRIDQVAQVVRGPAGRVSRPSGHRRHARPLGTLTASVDPRAYRMPRPDRSAPAQRQRQPRHRATGRAPGCRRSSRPGHIRSAWLLHKRRCC